MKVTVPRETSITLKTWEGGIIVLLSEVEITFSINNPNDLKGVVLDDVHRTMEYTYEAGKMPVYQGYRIRSIKWNINNCIISK
jgi:hypothetical protein